MGTASSVRIVFRGRAGHLRAGWRIAAYFGVVALLAAGTAGLARLGRTVVHAQVRLRGDLASWQSGLGFSVLCLVLIVAACIVLRFIDKRPCGLLGLGLSRRTVTEILRGLALGGGAVTVSCVAMWTAGVIAVEPEAISDSVVTGMARWFVILLVAAMVEELLTRGYPFQAAVEGMGRVGAVLAFSLIFGLGHAPNSGSTALGLVNAGVSGVLLSIAYLRTRSLHLPLAAHLAWNWVQGCVWGSNVSGVAMESSLLRVTPVGPAWLSGGAFGAEGSVITLVVLASMSAYCGTARWLRPSERNARLWEPYLSPRIPCGAISELVAPRDDESPAPGSSEGAAGSSPGEYGADAGVA